MYVRASFPTPPRRDSLAWPFQSTQGAQTGARELSHHGRGSETMAVAYTLIVPKVTPEEAHRYARMARNAGAARRHMGW